MVFRDGIVVSTTVRCTEMMIMRDADIMDFSDVRVYGDLIKSAELLIDDTVVARADCFRPTHLVFAQNGRLELPYLAMYHSIINIRVYGEPAEDTGHMIQQLRLEIMARQLTGDARIKIWQNFDGIRQQFVDGLSGQVKTIIIKDGVVALSL